MAALLMLGLGSTAMAICGVDPSVNFSLVFCLGWLVLSRGKASKVNSPD